MIRTSMKLVMFALPLLAACGGTGGAGDDSSQGALVSNAKSFPALSLLSDDSPVHYLQYTGYVVSAGRGGYGLGFHVDAAVRGSGYDKKVSARWSIDRWQSTQECALSYEKALNSEYELWGADCRLETNSSQTRNEAQVAVQATLNGQTYWDNNRDQNYSIGLSNDGGAFPSPNLAVRVQAPYVGQLKRGERVKHGTASVWPYPGQKSVSVIWSTDGWATTNTFAATEQSNGTFSWDIPFSAPVGATLSYAVAYKVDGVTFWDNDDGANFSENVP